VQAPGSGESWVSLRGWHVLRQSDPHLLIFDAGGASAGMREFARMIAARMNAAMTVLAVGEEGDEAGTGEDGLQARRRENRLPDADYRVRVGDAAEQIAAEQNEKLYSMIVIEPEGGRLAERVTRGRIKASGPGPVVMRLLERSMIPILVVNRERAKADRILICTAVGEPGKTDVRVGGRLARRLGASVTLLHVTREAGDPPPFVQDHLQRAASTVRALEVPAEISVRHAGAPAQGILEASREGDYDVIVVGSHGPQSRSLFGRDDVTLQVLRGADRPVLVVPSRE
jgi:nucleotide-binding universal stress UspA family protein